MAAVTGAVLGAGATLYAANQSKKATQSATNATLDAQNQAYYSNLANMQPYMTAGTNALNSLTALNNGDYSSFTESPDYQYTLSQGIQSLDRSAAAKGSLYSGGQSADLMNYASGLASQQYNNYYSKLASLAGMGQSSASALAGVNTNYANAVSNANSTAAYQNANTNSQLATGLAGLLNSSLQQSAAGRTSSYATTPTTGTSTWGNSVASGAGSLYNFGNNSGSWY